MGRKLRRRPKIVYLDIVREPGWIYCTDQHAGLYCPLCNTKIETAERMKKYDDKWCHLSCISFYEFTMKPSYA